jgi:hypothetical protein
MISLLLRSGTKKSSGGRGAIDAGQGSSEIVEKVTQTNSRFPAICHSNLNNTKFLSHWLPYDH